MFVCIRGFWIGNCLHLSVDKEVLELVPILYRCGNPKRLTLLHTTA